MPKLLDGVPQQGPAAGPQGADRATAAGGRAARAILDLHIGLEARVPREAERRPAIPGGRAGGGDDRENGDGVGVGGADIRQGSRLGRSHTATLEKGRQRRGAGVGRERRRVRIEAASTIDDPAIGDHHDRASRRRLDGSLGRRRCGAEKQREEDDCRSGSSRHRGSHGGGHEGPRV